MLFNLEIIKVYRFEVCYSLLIISFFINLTFIAVNFGNVLLSARKMSCKIFHVSAYY